MNVKWGDEETKSFVELMVIARKQIVATGLGSGIMECPKCKGKLHWSRAINYNGHVHARCETEDCLSWME